MEFLCELNEAAGATVLATNGHESPIENQTFADIVVSIQKLLTPISACSDRPRRQRTSGHDRHAVATRGGVTSAVPGTTNPYLANTESAPCLRPSSLRDPTLSSFR